jgi:hypothetical protein
MRGPALTMPVLAVGRREVIRHDDGCHRGHWLMEEQPVATVAAVRAFLISNSSSFASLDKSKPLSFRHALTGSRRGLPAARTSAKVRPSKKTRGAWGRASHERTNDDYRCPGVAPCAQGDGGATSKGLAYRIDPIIPFQANDEFSRLSPLRRIPVLIDD